MIWLILEALLALALFVGVIVWVVLPTQKAKKNGRGENTAPEKPPIEERERE